MIPTILIIAIILVLLFPKIFELLFSLVFSPDMSTTIIDAVNGSTENIISLQDGGGPVPMLNIAQSIAIGIGRNVLKSLFYILFVIMFIYLVIIVFAPFCAIGYGIIKFIS